MWKWDLGGAEKRSKISKKNFEKIERKWSNILKESGNINCLISLKKATLIYILATDNNGNVPFKNPK